MCLGLQADRTLLAPKKGFFGQFGERGIGGSRCGATGVVALVYNYKGATQLLAANVGDSRVLLIDNGVATQLTVDHIPDRQGHPKTLNEGQFEDGFFPLHQESNGHWFLT